MTARLETTASDAGLSQAEAQRRLAQFGPNELPEEKRNPLLEFLSHFWGPIRWMIEAAAVLSAVVRHWADFIIITVLLLGNAVVGFWEEYQDGNAIAALKATLALKARVKRDGEWKSLPARELVPGDLVRLRMGDVVPADAGLGLGDPIEVDQSALTGESLPVERKTGETAYSGSIVKMGEIEAVVSATGKTTFFGKTAALVESAPSVSHFQKAVLKIGDYLIVIALVLVAIIILVALLRGDRFTTTLQFALVLTVAAIPVAMPTVLSVTMAVGARLLARKQAIVSRLVAIEELAGMDVLCSDKTGTLTQNKLTLGETFCVENVSPDDDHSCGRTCLTRRKSGFDRSRGARRIGKQGSVGRFSRHAFPAVRSSAQTHRGRGGRAGMEKLSRSLKARPRSSLRWPRIVPRSRPRWKTRSTILRGAAFAR